jgi:hypothetical protein
MVGDAKGCNKIVYWSRKALSFVVSGKAYVDRSEFVSER